MMETLYESLFITSAANTVAQSSVWFTLDEGSGGNKQNQNYVAFAACNQVAISSVTNKKVLFTLRPLELENRLNCICCFKDSQGVNYVLCAGDNGFVNIWKLCRSEGNTTATSLSSQFLKCLSTEGKSISALKASSTGNHITVVATDTYGSLYLWESNEGDAFVLTKTLRFPTAQLPNTIAIHKLSSDTNLIAIGSVDARVHMYLHKIKTSLSLIGYLTGHEEWITCISTMQDPQNANVTYIASGSQDSKIRVWKMLATTDTSVIAQQGDVNNALLNFDEDDAEVLDADENAVTLIYDDTDDQLHKSQARLTFSADKLAYYITLESLLLGHEDWVTSIQWHAPTRRLFSTSMDRNMILWEFDASSSTFSPSTRVGDMGGALGGSIGGNLLGFVGGNLSPCGDYLLGVGYGGSFHLWQYMGTRWYPKPFLSGHFGTVEDMVYDHHNGDFLVTVSHDQTCRIFSYAPSVDGYHEISRPQIHGYDLNCVLLSYGSNYSSTLQGHRYDLLTAGEEKVVRVFEMPKIVHDGLQQLCHLTLQATNVPRVEQAYIPELGLSNKGKESMSKQEQKEQESRGVVAVDWSAEPPLESQLADCTLWLENDKLFGHNNDILAMAMTSDMQYMASSSKARYGQDSTALLLMWKIKVMPTFTTYEVLHSLAGNESTVICMQFSSNNQYLATGSKDRRLCLYAFDIMSQTYENVLILSSAHKRIIWDLSWHGDNEKLVSVSRDGSAKLWQVTCSLENSSKSYHMTCLHSFTSPNPSVPLTAVSIYPHPIQLGDTEEIYNILFLGCEDGHIYIYKLQQNVQGQEVSIVCLYSVKDEYCHSKTVKKIKCRPRTITEQEYTGKTAIEFASCSDDHTVRLHKIRL